MNVCSTEEMDLHTQRKRNYKFDLREKKRLLMLAKTEGYSDKKVCQEYNIPKGTFWGWKKQIDISLEYSKGKFTLHPGRKSTGEHLECVIDSFISEREQDQRECTVESIVHEIVKFDRQFMDSDFYRIRKWLYSYLSRKGFKIRSKTHVTRSKDL